MAGRILDDERDVPMGEGILAQFKRSQVRCVYKPIEPHDVDDLVTYHLERGNYQLAAMLKELYVIFQPPKPPAPAHECE